MGIVRVRVRCMIRVRVMDMNVCMMMLAEIVEESSYRQHGMVKCVGGHTQHAI